MLWFPKVDTKLYMLVIYDVPPVRPLFTGSSSKPSSRVLGSSVGPPSLNPQSGTASYQRRYKNGTR